MMNLNAKIGRNEKCWCGSNKKFKRCHLNRETEPRPGIQEVLDRFRKVYRQGKCSHPSAGHKLCKGKIIKAHTVQRNGGLNLIASNGHVYTLLQNGKMFDQDRWDLNAGPNKVGIGEASTFAGFCAHHDNELFAPIEKQPFQGTLEQIAILGYRAICHELFLKECSVEVANILRDLDKGQPFPAQVMHQEAVSLYESGLLKSIEEIQVLKSIYASFVFEKSFSNIGYYVVTFDRPPEIMCTGAVQATHDFEGNKIAELGHLDIPAHWMTFSFLATDNGGAAVFSYPSDHLMSERVLKSLNGLPDAERTHAIVRFAFEFFENTYFSPDWWDGLEHETRILLKERQVRDLVDLTGEQEHPRPNNCLQDDEVRAVSWQELSRMSSFEGWSELPSVQHTLVVRNLCNDGSIGTELLPGHTWLTETMAEQSGISPVISRMLVY